MAALATDVPLTTPIRTHRHLLRRSAKGTGRHNGPRYATILREEDFLLKEVVIVEHGIHDMPFLPDCPFGSSRKRGLELLETINTPS